MLFHISDLLICPVTDEGTLTFDFDLADDHEFDEDEEARHDPTFSKYTLEQMEKIVEMYFDKKWSLKTLQHNFKLIRSLKEVHR